MVENAFNLAVFLVYSLWDQHPKAMTVVSAAIFIACLSVVGHFEVI